MMITDTALIFEGGGMRASYTTGALITLLEQNIEFSDVYGISAGSTHAINYISKDLHRSKISFTEFMVSPGVSGWGHWLLGRGYFNAKYAYQEACMPGMGLEFDFDSFVKNPARPHIEAYEWDTGKTVYWGKEDMPTLYELMTRVRAGSTMPVFMPPVKLDGHTYFDGGIGDSWGIPLEKAKRDGYKKFFIVCTQKRGYRKLKPANRVGTRLMLLKYPGLADRMFERDEKYNAILDEIETLENRGDAYVYYPEEMSIKNTTVNADLLEKNYRAGYAQAQRELPAWREFLNLK